MTAIEAVQVQAPADWGIGRLDRRVAERIGLLGGEDDPAVLLAAMLAAAAPRGGHVCVDLLDVTGPVLVPLLEPDVDRDDEAAPGAPEERTATDGEAWPAPADLDEWVDRLRSSPVVRAADEDAAARPLVLDDSRVYLDRYWSYEDRLYEDLLARTDRAAQDPDAATLEALEAVAPWSLQEAGDGGPATDRQRLAVANGLLRPLSVISGGPGTGKTHTVVSLLAAHVLAAQLRGAQPPRIAIAAPTGKAAARLEEAIRDAVDERELPAAVEEVLEDLRASTLHRLLGYQRRSPTRFRHDRRTPLPYDLVIVDEASMVPLSLVTKLVEAVPATAGLVLVGDRNQLASIEAGAVLGDVCGPPPTGSSLRLSDDWAATLASTTNEDVRADRESMSTAGVWDGIVQLERFHRFGPASGIGAVARAIQAAGDPSERVLRLLRGEEVEPEAGVDAYDDVALVAPGTHGTQGTQGTQGLPSSLRNTVVAGLAPYVEAALAGDAETALHAIDEVRVLCATRHGPLGMHAVATQVENWLAEEHEGLMPDAAWFAGRPILVTRNDHDLDVMNGDVGVTVEHDGRLVVAFPDRHGGIRRVPTARIGDCETTWAMTIHKSQGSQFGHAIVVLPDRDSRVVSRELVYTGITRARARVTVVATEDGLDAALRRPVRRATGLRERLWPTSR